MYHYVRETSATPFPGIRALAPALFERQLDWLQANFTLVDLARVDAAFNGGPPLPSDSALLTFDDGLVDHHEVVFPVLRARGLSGVFFASYDASGPEPRLLSVHKTQFLLATMGARALERAVLAECALTPARAEPARPVFGADEWDEADERATKQLINSELPFAEADRVLDLLFERHIGSAAATARALYLNAEAIGDMARNGMAFGYHTRTHRMLSRLDDRAQAQEIESGVSWIEGLTGQTRVPFCYPWGGPDTYTPHTVRILADSGYALAFNTVRRRLQPGVDGRFEIPRIDTRDLPPFTTGDGSAGAAALPTEDA
jgi:peptidoglycan/xylan/chitin deacetylase (PgdA/CDA1 family)